MAVTMVIGNDPKISASLFAPGYSIAAVIANEFTEATGDMYLQALIELGLVLFLLTILINGLARLVIIATTQKGHDSTVNSEMSSVVTPLLAQIRERGHAQPHRGVRAVHGFRPLFHFGLSAVVWRQVAELGIFYQPADPCG